MDKIYKCWKHQWNKNISGGDSWPGNSQNSLKNIDKCTEIKKCLFMYSWLAVSVYYEIDVIRTITEIYEKDYLGHCKQKWSFLLDIFLVNMTKSTFSCVFD